MFQPPGSRTRCISAAVTAVALATVAAPSMAHAQSSSEAPPPPTTDALTGNSSVDGLIGQLPEEIIVGGDAFGSEGLRDAGSGEVVDGAQSVGQVVGSVAPLELIGVAGGSAAASVASSGSLPGSVYVNPTGSLGSGTNPRVCLPCTECAARGRFLHSARRASGGRRAGATGAGFLARGCGRFGGRRGCDRGRQREFRLRVTGCAGRQYRCGADRRA